MTVTGKAFVTRATLINDVDSKSHKMELKKAKSIQLINKVKIMQLVIYNTHTYTYSHAYSIAQKFGRGKIAKFNQWPVICQNLTF